MKNSKQGYHSPQIRDSSFFTARYTEVVSAGSPASLAHISPVSDHGQPARSFVTGVYLCWGQMRQNACEEVHKPSWDAAGTW